MTESSNLEGKFVILSQATVSCGSGTIIYPPNPTAVTTYLYDDLCIFLRALYIKACLPSTSSVLQKINIKDGKRLRFSLACCKILLSGCDERDGGASHIQARGLRCYLLALCVVILNQVLEEVHSFLGLDLIHFDQVLQSKKMCRVQPGVKIRCVFKGFLGLGRYKVAVLLHREKRRLLGSIHLEYEHFALWVLICLVENLI